MAGSYYFDTYALIEIAKESLSYSPYKKDVKIILNKLNIMEYVQYLFRIGKGHLAKETFDELSELSVDYDDEILIKAAEMKVKYSRDKVSFIDCIGYFIAKKNKAKFLTGDDKFKGMDNVEFVK